jgi:hypothetical protein
MTTTLQVELDELAQLIQQRETVTRVANEAREAWEAEYAAVLTEEKRLKLAVEQKKDTIRALHEKAFFEDGERPSAAGVSMAMLDTVEISDEERLIQFLAQYAPQLLAVKGKAPLKEWIFRHGTPVRTGMNQWDVTYELRGQNVMVRVPGVRISRLPSFRLEEKAIVTSFNQAQWEKENEHVGHEDQ